MENDASFRPRFSLRTALLAFVAAAVGCALLFSLPDAVAVPGLIAVIVALPASLTAGIIYGRRGLRAFCIGALFPTGLVLYTVGWLLGLLFVDGPGPFEDLSEWVEFCSDIDLQIRLYAGVSWAMALPVGALVAFVAHRTRAGKEAQG